MKKRSEDLLICVGYNCLSATLCYILLETTYYFFHVEAFVSPIVSLPGYPESMMSLIVGLPVLMQSTCSSLICIKFRPQSSKEREYVMHSLKVSQFMARAARLNEAFSVVKRVPMIRPSVPAAGLTPWPVMSLR